MSEPGSQISTDHSLRDRILSQRGLTLADLTKSIADLPDEALLANIDTAAERISRAMFRNEKLVIFGHDDPDGITSTYILYQFFTSCGYQKHSYFIPNRNLEPHGIQQSLIDFVSKDDYKLVIVVDNGITSLDGVKKLTALGCETIIIDHHIIQPEQLPEAYAIVNPQLEGSQYPFKMLAGAGVVLMLIRYLGRILEHPVPTTAYFWAAVGSIADKVPMNGLNRIIVRHALAEFDQIKDPTVEFLLRNHTRISNATDIFNFMVATSKLIANGREKQGQHTALRFMLQRGEAKAQLFQDMETQRIAWEGELNRIFGFLDSVAGGFSGNAFIYFDDEEIIPYPLLGTAASYILGKLRIPTIMLKTHNGNIVCEGRCNDGFSMVEAFRHCRDHLKQYGGHVKAAGFTLENQNYDAFLECYSEYLNEHPPAEPSLGVPDAEAAVCLPELNEQTWLDLEILLPFGQQNCEPVLAIQDTCWDELQPRFTLENGGSGIHKGIRGTAQVSWKNLQTLKILAFTGTPVER